MQQTKLDRWLQDRFVNETLVMTVREPPVIPKGIRLKELPQSLNNRYRYQMAIRKKAHLEMVLSALKKNSQTFTTRIRHRKGTAAHFFANPSGRSFSITLLAAFLGASTVFSAVIFFPDMLIDYTQRFLFPLVEAFKESAIATWNDVVVDTWNDILGKEDSAVEGNNSGIRESSAKNE